MREEMTPILRLLRALEEIQTTTTECNEGRIPKHDAIAKITGVFTEPSFIEALSEISTQPVFAGCDIVGGRER